MSKIFNEEKKTQTDYYQLWLLFVTDIHESNDTKVGEKEREGKIENFTHLDKRCTPKPITCTYTIKCKEPLKKRQRLKKTLRWHLAMWKDSLTLYKIIIFIDHTYTHRYTRIVFACVR